MEDVFEGKAPFPPATYRELITRYRHIQRLEGDFEAVVPDKLRQSMTGEQLSSLEAHLGKIAREYDRRVYDPIGNDMMTTGRIEPEQKLPWYSPVMLSRSKTADEEVLTRYVTQEIAHPSPENINTLRPGTLVDGETLDDLYRRNPELADQIVDELDAASIQLRGDKAFEAELLTRERLDTYQNDTLATLRAKWRQEIDEALEALETAKGKRVDALTARLEGLQVKLKAADGATGDAAGKLVAKYGNTQAKRRLTKFRKAAQRATRKSDIAATGNPVLERARDIARRWIDGHEPGDFVPDTLTNASGATKSRAFDHTRITDPEFANTFEFDAMILAQEHARAQVARNGLASRFGHLTNEGEDVVAALHRVVDAEFDRSLARAPDEATRKLITADRARARRELDRVLQVLLGKDRLSLSDSWRKWDEYFRVLTKVNIVAMLENLLAAQVTDKALLLAGGGRPGAGLFGMFSRGKLKSVMREVDKLDQPTLKAILKGPNAIGPNAHVRELWQAVHAGELSGLGQQSGSRVQALAGIADDNVRFKSPVARS
jgi:hypothetical protein